MNVDSTAYAKLSDISHFAFIKDKVGKLPYAFVKEFQILLLQEDEKEAFVAVTNTIDSDAVQEVGLLLNKPVVSFTIPSELLQAAINICYSKKKEQSLEKKQPVQVDIKQQGVEDYDLLDEDHQDPVVQLLNKIILEAVQQGASDIHFEPKENNILIRYRIDGVLLDRYTPPIDYHMQISARLKVMAHLDIAEKRLPQDGRIKLKIGKKEIDFRISSIPVIYGERIVLRILDRGNLVLGLDALGLPADLLKTMKDLTQFPEGIILVTGPTGSGKTTTLYSALTHLNSNEMNIMTIEDPVEYKLSNISQIAVNPTIQLTFAKGLRHILRQDPDVIMIGEIRDAETATIAIQASLTGHLVMSTLHTNDAPSALTRLVDMGVEPYLLSSTVVGIIAQRLVRKICPKCKYAYAPKAEEKKRMKNHFQLETLYRGRGCEHCFGTGYKGRQGLYEILNISPQIKHQIVVNNDSNEIKRIAKEQGMKDLFSYGQKLVERGITSIEELFRVTRTIS